MYKIPLSRNFCGSNVWNKGSLSLRFIEHFLFARTFMYIILNDPQHCKVDIVSVSVSEAQSGKSLARGHTERR